MMTTDPFTEAARAEAEKRHQGDWDPFEQGPIDDWGFAEAERRAFVTGAVWARTHLFAQEPTDAEVEAAQAEVVLHAPDFTKPGVIRCHCGAPGFWSTPDAHEQHALWHALRAARRDEEIA